MLTDNGTANETLQARAVACAKSVSTTVECRRQWRETRLPKVHVWSFVSVRYKSASVFFVVIVGLESGVSFVSLVLAYR